MEYQIGSAVVSSLEKILPYQDPKEIEEKGSALLGETYHFQLAFRFETALPIIGEAKVIVSGPLAKYIKLFVADLVPANTYSCKMDDYYLGKEYALTPDVLREFGAVGLPLPYNQWKSVWVSVEIPEDFASGEYEMQFELQDKNGKFLKSVSHTLEIVGAKLAPNDLVSTNWMHYDCISQWHGVSMFSDKFYAVFKEYLKEYVAIGFNALLTPIFTPPLDTAVGAERKTAQLIDIKVVNGEYKFSFAKLKKFLKFVFENGIKYIEFSHLFTQWGGRATPKIIANVNGKQTRIFGWDVPSDDDRYVAFLSAFLPKLKAFIEKEKLEKRCYFHLTDEPHTTHIPTYEKCKKLVKSLIGDLPTMDAISNADFYDQGLVDIPVPLVVHYPDFAKRNVQPLFVYNCCEPADGYYSNRFINMPSQRTRILGMQLYQTGVQGYLHWGYNFYNAQLSVAPIDPYFVTDACGGFPSGDGFIVYPKDGGINTSIRAKNVQDGFQDYRALKTLESYIGREKTLEFLKERGIEGYTVYPRCAKTHKEIRNEINFLIKENL